MSCPEVWARMYGFFTSVNYVDTFLTGFTDSRGPAVPEHSAFRDCGVVQEEQYGKMRCLRGKKSSCTRSLYRTHPVSKSMPVTCVSNRY